MLIAAVCCRVEVQHAVEAERAQQEAKKQKKQRQQERM